jgi:hypothetical protein
MTTIYKYDEKDNCIEEIRDYDRTTTNTTTKTTYQEIFLLIRMEFRKGSRDFKGYNEYTVTYWISK